MESLLVNVSKYASSHQTSPTENFITEAFAWLLKYDDVVRKAYARILAEKSPQHRAEILNLSTSTDIETQVNFGGKYPDLLWNAADEDFCLVFEHKVWSELHDKQLSNYRKFAETHLNKSFLIALVTAHSGQHRQSPNIALCWYEVANIIESLGEGENKESWLRAEFVNLIKSNGLVNSTPLNPLAIAYYNDVKNIDKQLYEIARRSLHRSWPVYQEGNKVKFHLPPKHRNARGRYDAFGRIGLEFSSINAGNDESGWIPGIFCGFIIDGYDHQVEDLVKNGPIASLVLSVNKSIQSSLKSQGHYDLLVNEIKAKLPTDWKLSDRTIAGLKLNPWHPLIVYRELTSFIQDAQTLEEQTEVYFTQMAMLQSIFLESDAFNSFCTEMQRLSSEETK